MWGSVTGVVVGYSNMQLTRGVIRDRRFRVFLIYVFLLHLFTLLVLVKSDFFERVLNKLGYIDEITEHYERMTTYHGRIDVNVSPGSIIFIGDSITQGLATSEVSDRSVNYGIGSDTTVGVLRRLKLYDSISEADAVVILIGVNDFRHRDSDSIVTNYEKIINSISDSSKVVAVSILPIDEGLRSFNPSTEGIHASNNGIKSISRNHSNMTFCDVNSYLSNEKGDLEKRFHIGDGVHLNQQGNAILIQRLRSCLDLAGVSLTN